jgi:hypothetical protein
MTNFSFLNMTFFRESHLLSHRADEEYHRFAGEKQMGRILIIYFYEKLDKSGMPLSFKVFDSLEILIDIQFFLRLFPYLAWRSFR